MGNLYYLDVLRQVHPAEDSKIMEDTGFFLFGEFDAMFFQQPNGKQISALKQIYEDRHEGPIGARAYDSFLTTDRYPIFLYDSSITSTNIFNRDYNDATRPLVVTLIQMDKTIIPYKDPNELISECKKSLDKYISDKVYCQSVRPCENNDCQIAYDIFWNLGQADLVIVFRAERLLCITKLLIAIRNIASLANIPILSTSSYCGFPNSPEWTSNLKKWLIKEEAAPFNLHIQYDVLAGDHKIKDGLSFIFGERDYQEYLNGSQYSKVEDLLYEIISSNLSGDDECKPWYRTSYTIPSFSHNDTYMQIFEYKQTQNLFNNKSKNKLEEIKVLRKSLADRFDKYVELIYRTYNDIPAKEIASVIESFRKTICGLLGFLIRLFIGRYEQDIYCYILPVFSNLIIIMQSYIDINNELYLEGDHESKKIIENNVDEFIRDTGELVTRLQQIFLVLAISPHTFLETYGSSMRSLAATSKLMGAYQGTLIYIRKNFPDMSLPESKRSHSILVTPYRRANPNNRLLYGNSSPLTRISQIQVDYAKMFKRHAMFMLLHEGAHVITDRAREVRFRYYVASMTQKIFYSATAAFIHDPVNQFIGNINGEKFDKDRHDMPSKNLFFGTNLETHFTSRIKNMILEFITLQSETVTDALVKKYENLERNSDFAFYMKSIDKWLSDTLSKYFSLPKCINDIVDILLEEMLSIAVEIRDELAKNNGNVREAIRLELLYRQNDIYGRYKRDFSACVNAMLVDPNSCTMLTGLFKDVYSDLLPLIVLNVTEPSEYIDTLFEFAGAKIQEWYESDGLLLRIMTIAEVMGWKVNEETTINDGSFFDVLVKQRQLPVETLNNALLSWKRLYKLPYRLPLLEYANFCKSTLKSQVLKLEHEPEIKAIRGLWRNGDEDDVVPHIYVLWHYLLENTASDQTVVS